MQATTERRHDSGWAFPPMHEREEVFISDRRSFLECGCAIFIGSSMVGDELTEPGSRAVPCSRAHRHLVTRAVELQVANLDNPDFASLPAEEVAGEMLEEAWNELH